MIVELSLNSQNLSGEITTALHTDTPKVARFEITESAVPLTLDQQSTKIGGGFFVYPLPSKVTIDCHGRIILRRSEEQARTPNRVPDTCPCAPGDRPINRDVLQSQTPPLRTRLPNPRRSSCRVRRVAGRSMEIPRTPCPRDVGRLILTLLYHNGRTEGINTRTKRIMRQMRGRSRFDLRHRILLP